MSPRLARQDYFLRVLNEPDATHAYWIEQGGALAENMHRLLLRMAASIRDKMPVSEQDIHDLNQIFHEYRAVRLTLSVAGEEGGSFPLSFRFDSQRLALNASLEDENQGKRVYMEALISLFERLEAAPFELRMCIECAGWYIPYNRAQVSKFCSAKCRNQFNYRARKEEGFVCGVCEREQPLNMFSGLVLQDSDTRQFTVGSVHHRSPVCLGCAEAASPARFQTYIQEMALDRQNRQYGGGAEDDRTKILSRN
ncbi:hypothetical protein ACAF76_016685 [Brevibacillus sp. TJ4]|uniref:hypothetical protein n=1 Tax=Brevibacillus sp. TJ4 TaxID=3234853 RepID=UPI0037D60531